MIDKVEIGCRFRRSVESYDENAHVQKIITERLCTLVKDWLSFIPANILEIGCGTGLLTEKIVHLFHPERLIINDLVGEMCSKAASRCQLPESCCLQGDIEELPLMDRFGLILSASTFQWFSRPAVTFAKLADSLEPGGWMLFSTFGADNLREIRAVTGAGLTYRSREEMIALLAPYFDILYTEEELHTVYFSHPMEILQHLKKTGVNAGSSSQIWTRGRIQRFVDDYMGRFAESKRLPLTYHPIYFICRKKSF